MPAKLNALYNMWSYSEIDKNFWFYNCSINGIPGHIAFLATSIEKSARDFIITFKEDYFWLFGVGFYPDNPNIVSAEIDVRFSWGLGGWWLAGIRVINDNIDEEDRGEMKTITGRVV